MKKSLLPLWALLAAVPGAASQNPDGHATFELSQGSMSSLHGDLVVHQPFADVKETIKSMNVNTGAFLLVPATDNWSFQAGVGADWTEQDVIGALTNGGSTSDKNVLSGSLSARRFFGGSPAAEKNPDRRFSLALNANGADTVHYDAGNANGGKPKKVSSHDEGFSLDLRWPLNDAWTATAAVGGDQSYSRFDPSPIANGIQAVSNTGFVSAGFRWFWVGRNMIGDDAGENPDRWTMVFATLGVNKDFSGGQTVRDAAGIEARRDAKARGGNLTLGVRLPATNHLSLRIQAEGGASRSVVPILSAPAQAGSTTRLATLTFSAALRYFLF